MFKINWLLYLSVKIDQKPFLSPKNTQSICSSLERCSVSINISRGDIKLEKKGPVIDEKDIREIKRIKVNHAGEKVLTAMKDIL
jgi:hypothetical protein